MNLYIDESAGRIIVNDKSEVPLYSPAGFKLISELYVKVGWDQKYLYSFSWLGRPIIQIPDDAFRIQECIYQTKPDVIIETGIAHGGSLVFSASLCKAMGRGKVIGVDIDIRSHNRSAIENHELFPLITLVEGSSIEPKIIDQVKANIPTDSKVMVILDSCHDYVHVLEELRMYGPLVSVDSFIVATDGSQEYLNATPRAQREYPHCADWQKNNPKRAAEDFVRENQNFKITTLEAPFNEGMIEGEIVTHWPSGYIRRIR